MFPYKCRLSGVRSITFAVRSELKHGARTLCRRESQSRSKPGSFSCKLPCISSNRLINGSSASTTKHVLPRLPVSLPHNAASTAALRLRRSATCKAPSGVNLPSAARAISPRRYASGVVPMTFAPMPAARSSRSC